MTWDEFLHWREAYARRVAPPAPDPGKFTAADSFDQMWAEARERGF